MESALQKKFRFYGTILRRNFVPGKRPYKAILIVTWTCQARCVMCDIWKRKPENELTLDEWRTFFQRNSYLKWLTLSGGEPFLRNDLPEIVEAAYQHCPGLYAINTPTNSLAPDKILSVVKRIVGIGIPEYVLSISLDGPPDVHDSVRGTPGAFDKAMRLLQGAREIQASRKSGFRVAIEHTLLPAGYGRFFEMVEAVRQRVPGIEITDFFVATAHVSEHYYGNTGGGAVSKNPAEREQMEKAVRHVLDSRRTGARLDARYLLPQLYLEQVIPSLRTRKPPMRCRATRSTIFIDPNGAVYPCNAWNVVLGQLRDSDYSLETILSRPDIDQIRRDIDAFKCGGCWTPCEALVSLAEMSLQPAPFCRLARMAAQTILGHRKTAAATTPAKAGA